MDEDPDIDIEETALIYPRIQSIYSDVNIKTEPIDIDEDDYESIAIEESSNDYYMQIPNKIILGSKPSTQVKSEPTPGPSTASDNWEEQENFFECGECNLLFSTENDLDFHKMSSHSFLIARPLSRAIKTEREISLPSTSSHSFYEDSSSQEEHSRRQKAVKSTSKSALNVTFPMLHKALQSTNDNLYNDMDSLFPGSKRKETNDTDKLPDGLLCKHCDVRFPDEIALIKHTYELLPDSKFKCDVCQMQFNSKAGLKAHRLVHFREIASCAPSDSGASLLQCVYCSCFLMHPGTMKRHLLKNHKVTDFQPKHTKFTGKCAICSRPSSSYTKYNKHIFKCHRKELWSKTQIRYDTGPVKMKCVLCNEVFSSRYSAYKHKSIKHPDNVQRNMFFTMYEKPMKQIPPHTQQLKAKLQSSKSVQSNSFIPKQTLFKCNKCQIHFVSCLAAFTHSKRCTLAKGDWKCWKCRRTFTNVERYIHTQQHQFSEKFKVHKVSDKILNKVLCQCPNCEVYFDETAFRQHSPADCIPENRVECKSCNLKIHTSCIIRHRKNHTKYNFSSDDFVLITFVDSSFQNASPKKEIKEGQVGKQDLLYCTTCKCHSYVIIRRSYHLQGDCKSLGRRLCSYCGLVFSLKPYRTHIKVDHETHNLKLDDFRIRTMQDSKLINPVMPDFFQCRKCQVRFISPVLRNNHNCSKQVFQKCSQCFQKYDSDTYKIHLAFHNYGRPKTELNSSAVPLKFYSCVACSYGFHSYDGVVEHCQNHYTNSENLVSQPCKLCKLNYADDHKNLHSNQARFEVYKFDYEKLLTENWLEGFGSLPKDVVGDILSRSVYGVLRNVRLELLMEGPAERTLYKCVQCKLNFDDENVVEHTLKTCSKSPRFKCGSCSAAFRTRDDKNKHANVHVIYGDDITFREISFNNDDDKELNEVLRTGRQKESLKFRKCQHCELLIKISDYQVHVAAHNDKVEISKQFSNSRTGETLSYKLFKPENAAKKPYTLYKCRSCHACVLQKVSLVRHRCVPQNYKKCSKCCLNFLHWMYPKHIQQHKTDPKFIPKNIAVLEFEVVGIGKTTVKKRRRYSSDDDAAPIAGAISVSKTYETRKVIGKPYTDSFSEDSQDIKEDDATETSATFNTYAKKYIKKTCIETIGSDNEREKLRDVSIKDTPEKNEGQSEMPFNVERWRNEMRNKLYQCNKCYLFFVHSKLLVYHLLKCDENNLSETPLICHRCDIVFHPSLMAFHEKLHELVNQNPIENYIYLINISTNGVDTDNKNRWLYNCKLCDIHYLNTKSLAMHFSTNHSLQTYFNCEFCDLKFTQRSRTKHKSLQHNRNKWSKDELHVEITQKKIVKEGEIKLSAFVKPHLLHKERSIEIEEICDGDTQSSVDTTVIVNRRTTAISAEVSNDTSSATSPLVKLPIDHHLYKCPTCSKYYLSEYTLVRHIKQNSHKAKAVPCVVCGLHFGKRTLEAHIRTQHVKLNLSREDFVINENQSGINDEKEKIDDSGDLNAFDNQRELSETANDTNQSQNVDDNDSTSENTKTTKLFNSDDDIASIDNHIYKCVECSIFYTDRHTLLLHVVVKKHQKLQNIKCDVCGLMFGSGSLKQHKSVQHEKLKLTRNDFIITDVFGSKILDDKHNDQSDVNNASSGSKILDDKDNDQSGVNNASSIDTENRTLTDLDDEEKLESKEVVQQKRMPIFRLYQCMHCRVCVEKTQRNLHVCCSDIQKKQCIDCCLSFKNTDVPQHRRLHWKHPELCRKNFFLIRFGHCTSKDNRIYKCETCSTHFIDLRVLEWHMNAWNHQTKRSYCENCGLFFGKNCLSRHVYIHHTKLHLTVQQFKIICVSDVDKTHKTNPSNTQSTEIVTNDLNNSMDTTVSEQNLTPNVNIVKKLFKCVECDVYFLTRASYYHHIYKHRKLGATEYIDCNICDLQFLNEALGVHMKSHKDKSFCLDELLIEEYQPNSAESLGIRTYFAKDNLNSKLVSTTTLFDNDDDTVLKQTDEQLSIIDSTSDEIPKTTPDELANVVDNNIYPPNSNPRREEVNLNQNIEMPNLEVCVKLTDKLDG